MKEEKKILCTIGPATIDGDIIRTLSNTGVDIFRINLSHTDIKDLKRQILHIREYTDKAICLDTEGAQVRTGRLEDKEIVLNKDDVIEIHHDLKIGDASSLTLYPVEIYNQLEESDILNLDFDSASLVITKKHSNGFTAKVLSSGVVRQNIAVNGERPFTLPALTEKDKLAIEIGNELKTEYVALSFASCANDMKTLKDLTSENIHLIAKIESFNGLSELDGIVKESDSILIDRGDLGREVPLESIPFIQKYIINYANQKETPVFVATNLLESMVSKRQPTRAEVNDVINTLIDGADGLVLAAETAIGDYPIDCVKMIKRLISYATKHSLAGTSQNLSTEDRMIWKSWIET